MIGITLIEQCLAACHGLLGSRVTKQSCPPHCPPLAHHFSSFNFFARQAASATPRTPANGRSRRIWALFGHRQKIFGQEVRHPPVSLGFWACGGRCPKIFHPHPKSTQDCPAQPPADIPGAGGKMSRQAKKSHNEKWKALLAQATHELDLTVLGSMEGQPQPNVVAHLVRTQIILVDLLETLVEREEPG